jgi:hypothetical protein
MTRQPTSSCYNASTAKRFGTTFAGCGSSASMSWHSTAFSDAASSAACPVQAACSGKRSLYARGNSIFDCQLRLTGVWSLRKMKICACRTSGAASEGRGSFWRASIPFVSDPQAIYELEKAKLIRHHARRRQQLGADEKLIKEIVQNADQPPAAEQVHTFPVVIRRACPAKVCRGALGFRARQTRKKIRFSQISRPELLVRDGQ